MRQFFSIAILAFTGLGLFLTNGEEASVLQNGYEIGDQVTDFTLKTVAGNEISLYESINVDGNKGAIVIFTCNTCPYAVAYEDRIIDLHDRYATEGYPVIAINPNDPEIKPGDSFEKMIERSTDKAFPFPYAFDESQEVFVEFGATKTPTVYLVDDQYKVRYIGAIDNNATDPSGVSTKYVEDAIAAVVAGKDPKPAVTKAVGCGIKYRKGA